jgi:hypothetical protein
MAGMDFEIAKMMDRCYTQLSVRQFAGVILPQSALIG